MVADADVAPSEGLGGPAPSEVALVLLELADEVLVDDALTPSEDVQVAPSEDALLGLVELLEEDLVAQLLDFKE